MVVAQDDRCGVVGEGSLRDFAWMDRGPIDRPEEQLLEGQESVAIIEEQHGEHLTFFSC